MMVVMVIIMIIIVIVATIFSYWLESSFLFVKGGLTATATYKAKLADFLALHSANAQETDKSVNTYLSVVGLRLRQKSKRRYW